MIILLSCRPALTSPTCLLDSSTIDSWSCLIFCLCSYSLYQFSCLVRTVLSIPDCSVNSFYSIVLSNRSLFVQYLQNVVVTLQIHQLRLAFSTPHKPTFFPYIPSPSHPHYQIHENTSPSSRTQPSPMTLCPNTLSWFRDGIGKKKRMIEVQYSVKEYECHGVSRVETGRGKR